ncbi:hypothetical protein H5410_002908 [Solanum commersonii]|uniref:DUF4283 domain-containing protein n=1 Tax=Solanum commersonii TaxID=4109 RepID=A0A9J6B472_SOLCO|nr:hypothetical protein H5410_002908 [Solanum commersonii]
MGRRTNLFMFGGKYLPLKDHQLPFGTMIGKFSYGWPDLEDLRNQIPKQCKIKGECKIGLLRHRHILMRFNLMEDFVNILSKNPYYIMGKDGIAYQMRPFIYDANFKPGEETTQTMAWISFPDLLPTFFVKESLFSLASAVGKQSNWIWLPLIEPVQAVQK